MCLYAAFVKGSSIEASWLQITKYAASVTYKDPSSCSQVNTYKYAFYRLVGKQAAAHSKSKILRSC